MQHGKVRLLAVLVCLLFVSIFGLGGSAINRFLEESRENYRYCNTDNEAEKHKAEKDCRGLLYKASEDPVALFTAVLTVATVGLFGATYFLWRATRDLVRGADRTAEKQLRAYISVDQAAMSQDWPSHDVVFTIIVKNYGQTPAYGVQTCVQPAYGGANQVPFDEEYEFRSESVVGPGSTVTIGGRVPLTPEKLEFVRKGECKIFVWGRVNYRDAFDRQRFFSFRAYNEGAQTKVAPDRASTYLVFAVSPARNGYQAN